MAENIFFETTPLLSQGVDDRPPPPPPPHNVPGLTLIIHNFETNKQNSTNPDIFVKFDRINSLDPPLWCLTFLCPGGNITDPQISLTHVTVEKPKVYSRPTSVRQNLDVATLGRLGPKRLTALKRKRRVAHPVRLKVKDVALGFVTFSML